jgi:hypothetical protein
MTVKYEAGGAFVGTLPNDFLPSITSSLVTGQTITGEPPPRFRNPIPVFIIPVFIVYLIAFAIAKSAERRKKLNSL